MVRALVAFRHTLPMGRGQEEFLELLLCSFYTSEGIRALLMTPWAAARQVRALRVDRPYPLPCWLASGLRKDFAEQLGGFEKRTCKFPVTPRSCLTRGLRSQQEAVGEVMSGAERAGAEDPGRASLWSLASQGASAIAGDSGLRGSSHPWEIRQLTAAGSRHTRRPSALPYHRPRVGEPTKPPRLSHPKYFKRVGDSHLVRPALEKSLGSTLRWKT
ncbi:PREDICTED: uncharacterized protein LOC105575637 isoform X1 [Cercocebus atys]|uniref:uncharacterized protein LOC105575637 isoform X1 n=1 Tax=Cercocebus atys TaxID=9531 RepID=UPI0005F3D405|nr:PREDICTED: uncharacterized protein LOC105575637 isoform X1 [Cercocebus atys]